MIVTLVGYRGSGKTSVAKGLAEKLGWDWIDADEELERREGRTIREVFDTDGEDYFRKVERTVMADLVQRDRLVVAAGGGAILNETTRTEITAAGPVVWLRAAVEEIQQRIMGDSTTSDRRPNLTPVGGRDEIEQLLTQREPLYRECASIIVDTHGINVGEVVERVRESIDAVLHGEA